MNAAWDDGREHIWHDRYGEEGALAHRLILAILSTDEDGYKLALADIDNPGRHRGVIHELATVAAGLWVSNIGPIDSRKDLALAIDEVQDRIAGLLDWMGETD